jgi:hypothetical protein
MNALRLRSRLGRAPRSRGQSLVEFSLILPIFLLILAGILDFGFMLNARMTLISGTREAARWAVVQSDPMTIPGDYNSSSGHLGGNLPGLVWANVSYNVACIPGNPPVNNCDFIPGGANRDPTQDDILNLSTTYTYRSFFASLFGATVNLSASVQVVLEAPQ